LSVFSPSHRGGCGPPIVCLHGFMDTWRTWELVLPLLERRHEVLALTLPGHAGGPRLPSEPTAAAVTDAVEAAIDAAGFSDPPQLVGNSLGGFVALQLAARGRARSVVAFAPAGGWAPGDDSHRDLLAAQREAQAAMRTAAPAATSDNLEAHRMLGMAAAPGAGLLIERALRDGWSLDAARITAPVRIVWGLDDPLLPWPRAAQRFLDDWLPGADYIELEGIGHHPQLEDPATTAALILDWQP
jgi:pimeloyl-ACP methyl ester carboxylesterase